MSAYIVSTATITALVHAALTPVRGDGDFRYVYNGHVITCADGSELGEKLVRANVASVAYRYPSDSADTLPGPVNQEWATPYQFPMRSPVRWDAPNPVVILKVLACYEYQSCERPDWESSEAHAIVEAIRLRMIHRLPGYEDAPWGVDVYPIRPQLPKLVGLR